MMSQLPARAGVGLKPEHYREILDGEPDIGFFEVHAENYMGAGGPPHRYLEAIRARYPLSVHGVGLSIGGERPLDKEHLARLKLLIQRYQPDSFSEHLAWSSHDCGFLNDLLPLPYTQETLQRVIRHVDEVQTALGVRMLLENPSTYVIFEASTIPETEFIAEIARATGCGLLLDVNNIVVSAVNHGFDPMTYLAGFPLAAVGEIHLAGYAEAEDDSGERFLIDAHGTPVADEVFALYRHILSFTGPMPTLIEWDNDVPAFQHLMQEAARAELALQDASRMIRHAAA